MRLSSLPLRFRIARLALAGLVLSLIVPWSASSCLYAHPGDDDDGHHESEDHGEAGEAHSDHDEPHGESAEGDAAHGDEHGADEAHHPDYNEPPINPNRGMLELFIFSLVLFLAFVFGARQFAWKPLIAAFDQREARVNQAHADAEQAKVQAERLLAEHDEKMAEVQEQVKDIVSRARQEAEAEKARIIAEATAQADAARDSALDEIRQAREEALSQLMGSVDQQVDLAIENIVGRPIG